MSDKCNQCTVTKPYDPPDENVQGTVNEDYMDFYGQDHYLFETELSGNIVTDTFTVHDAGKDEDITLNGNFFQITNSNKEFSILENGFLGIAPWTA